MLKMSNKKDKKQTSINEYLNDFEQYINNYNDIKLLKKSYFDKLIEEILLYLVRTEKTYAYYVKPQHEYLLIDYVKDFVDKNDETTILNTIKSIHSQKFDIDSSYPTIKMPDILQTNVRTPRISRIVLFGKNNIEYEKYKEPITKKVYEKNEDGTPRFISIQEDFKIWCKNNLYD